MFDHPLTAGSMLLGASLALNLLALFGLAVYLEYAFAGWRQRKRAREAARSERENVRNPVYGVRRAG